jgi:hypothetical protein
VGETDEVKDMFRELRDSGLGSLSTLKKQNNIAQIAQEANYASPPSTEVIEIIDNVVVNDDSDIPDEYKYPSIQEVAVNKYPDTEEEWVLKYAFYAAEYGKNNVIKADIKAKYKETNRVSGPRYNSFDINIKSLVQKTYIKILSTDLFKFSELGKSKVNEILNRQVKINKSKSSSNNGNGKKNNLPQFCDLQLSQNNLDTLINAYSSMKLKTNIDKVFIIMYLGKKICNIGEVDNNLIFTLLDIVKEKKALDIESTIKNMKNRNYNLIQDGIEKGKYKLVASKEETYYRELKGEKNE